MTDFLLKRNVPLSSLTTFRVGGVVKYLAQVKNHKGLVAALKFAKKSRLPTFVLGGGSDILISDKKFSGLVIKYLGKNVRLKELNGKVLVTVEAGMVWDDLVKVVVQQNLQGIECMSGIPGTVGASPIQNIGAYGQELKDVFVKLRAYDIKKEKFVILTNEECEFAYRESTFKKPENKGRYLITNITIKLNKGKPPVLIYESLTSYLKENNIIKPTLSQVRDAVLNLRGKKLDDPKIIGNAGSFFKNPVVDNKTLKRLINKYPDIPFHLTDQESVKLFAGWLIEKTGWKGKKYKNTQVSSKNALVITNPEGKATAKEIKELADKVSDEVYRKFRVRLFPEVQYIGFE